MRFRAEDAITQIDEAISRFEAIKKRHTVYTSEGNYIETREELTAEVVILLRNTYLRLAPNGEDNLNDLLKGLNDIYYTYATATMNRLAAALRVLRGEYASGRLRNFRELVTSDVFSDFLEMAEHLLTDDGYKDPAAVLAGGVLEQHVRKLCEKHSVPTTTVGKDGSAVPKKLDTMNADLAKADVYGKNDQKQVVAWAGIRNAAAHAKYDEYTADQVRLMIQGVRDFMARNPG